MGWGGGGVRMTQIRTQMRMEELNGKRGGYFELCLAHIQSLLQHTLLEIKNKTSVQTMSTSLLFHCLLKFLSG